MAAEENIGSEKAWKINYVVLGFLVVLIIELIKILTK